jgi:hypothetical protein
MGREYDEIAQDSLQFSPDGRRIGYIALLSGKWFVAIDDVVSEAYDKAAELLFSPDGKRVGYVVRQEQRWAVVIDGVLGAKYDIVFNLAFSPNSQRYAYYAVRNEKCLLVVDGVESREYDAVFLKSPVVFETTDSLRFIAERSGRFLLVQARITRE